MSDLTTDFANKAEQEEYQRNLERVRDIRKKRAEDSESETPEAAASETDEAWAPDSLADGQTIFASGRKALGLSDDWQPSSNGVYGSMKQMDDVFRAGLQAEGITVRAHNMREFQRASSMLVQGAAAVGSDVGRALSRPGETASQVPAGLIDAWNEINRFGASLDVLASDTLGYWPALQVFDEAGDLALEIQDAGDPETRERLKGEDNLLIGRNPIDNADTVTGNLVRGISQFAVPFSAANKALKGVDALAKPGAWRQLSRFSLAGIAADFSAFNPEAERLTDFADQLGFPVIDYLKSDEDDSEWESRFKNAIEGGAIGGAADLLFEVFRGMKGMRRVQEGLNDRIRELDRQEAEAADAIQRDIWGQGDPNGAAVEVFGPPRAETTAETAARRDANPLPDPVVNGQRYLDEDLFEMSPDGDAKFAFGNAIENRARFVQEEVVALPNTGGTLYGFSARAGQIAVEFSRGAGGAIVDFDWLDPARSQLSRMHRRNLGLQDVNEVFSKIGAIIETDAGKTGTPKYTFAAESQGLDRVYQRLGPKLADRIGYDFKITDDGFELTRTERAAADGNEVVYQPETSDTGIDDAYASLQRQLDSKFAISEGDDAFTGELAAARLSELREAGRKAFGSAYEALEADGRVSFARQAGDLDPEWTRFNSGAQAITGRDGRVVIFTRATEAADMEGLLLHEVGIHSGMQGMVGQRGFNSLLKRVDELVAAGDGPATRARGRVPETTTPSKVSEETLAYMVQYAPEHPLVKDVVARLKAAAAKQFPGIIDRLKLNEADFRQLAVLSLRREAIISGQTVAMFGRIGEIVEAGQEPPAKKPMFQLTQPLVLDDKLALGNAMPVRQALDLEASGDDMVGQVLGLRDDLLSPGFVERLFQADEGFEPFVWRDTVEAIAAGDTRPDILQRFKDRLETVKDPDPKGDDVLFSMREAPGRLDDRLNSIVLDDIKSGRRGLERDEAEALLGAAERWAAAVRRQQPSRAQTYEDLIEQIKTRNDPEDMRYLVELMDGAKATVSEPPSLMTFLRKLGGIKDEGGELAARDLGRVRFTNNKSGLNMDEALERAWEAGYIGRPIEGDALGPGALPADQTRPSFNDLLNAIDRELTGEKVYSYRDLDWVQETAARQDMRAELERLGVNPDASKAEIVSEFERIALWQEGEPLTLKDMRDIDLIEKRAQAKPGVGLPDRDLLGGSDVRINFNAIQTSDDIRSVMGQLADAFAGELDAARGGSRSNQQIIKDSRRLSAWEALNTRRGDTPLSDAEVPAAQALYIASAENVKKAIEQATKTGSDMAHYQARRALSMHRAIQAEIAGAKADASRALRAWSVTQSATAQARRELAGVMEQYGGRLDAEEAARLRTMIDSNPEGFDKAVRTMGRNVSDIAGEILRCAWLSGPQTHVMNLAGNTLTMMYDVGVRLGSGVKGKVTGDPALEHQLSVAVKEYAGLIEGVRTQFRAFGRRADYGRMGRRLQEARARLQDGDFKSGLKTGASALAFDNPLTASIRGRFDDRGVSGQGKFNANGADRAISAERFNLEQGSASAKLINGVGAIISAPVEFLGFADDFFKGVNELATRYRMAQEMVLKEGELGLAREDMAARFADIVDNPPDEVLQEARRVAQRRTFTEPVGPATRGLLGARNWLNSTGFPLGHLLFPFIVTPSNILKFAFQNGPTGALFQEVRNDLEAGGVKRAQAQARIAAGTGMLILGMDMVANGVMTGRAPSDPGERELWERQGRQEYSIRVLGKWISYRRLEPVSTMLAIGADLQTIMLNSALDDDASPDMAEVIGPALGAAINVVTSKTYLTSMTEFLKFTEDGERYGPQFVERLAASIAAPAIAAQTEKLEDPIIREASSVIERTLSRMPGFSKDLPISYDLWGRPRHVSSGLGSWYDALSPFTIRTEDAEPIDAELQRLGFYPTRPAKSITVQSAFGVRVAVNLRNRPDIWSRYVELAGNEEKMFDGLGAKDYLNRVIEGTHSDSVVYNSLPDSATEPLSKERFIKRRIDQAREVARFRLQQEFETDLHEMAEASLEAQRLSEQRRSAVNVN